jgi:3-hydroxybutyryl-CoA dehydrogenase
MSIQSRVAVLGAGVMGAGIAQVFASHGWSVVMCDLSAAHLERAMEAIYGNLAVMREAGLLDAAGSEALLARVRVSTDTPQAVADAQVVIEAVSESVPIKTEVFAMVARHAPPDAAIWSNTSTLDVFSLAPPALRERLLVAHWFAPPHILPLVEVVSGESTREDVVQDAMDTLRALGKAPVRTERYVPGFIINRLLRALGREAMYLIDNGYVTAQQLDQAVRASLAPRMLVLGIMQRYDFTGLDLSVKNLKNPEFTDAPVDLAPRPLLDLVAAGDLGVKTGRGFYEYADMTPVQAAQRRDRLLWEVVGRCSELIMAPRSV